MLIASGFDNAPGNTNSNHFMDMLFLFQPSAGLPFCCNAEIINTQSLTGQQSCHIFEKQLA